MSLTPVTRDPFAHAWRILAPVAGLKLWWRRIINLTQDGVYHVLMKFRSYTFQHLEDLENPLWKSPLKTPSAWFASGIHHWPCLERSPDLRIWIMFILWLEIFPLWCSQFFLIFMEWCFNLLQIQSICSPVTRNRRIPYILWTVNKSVNWLFCSQNSATTGISWHSNFDFAWKWICSKVIALFLPYFCSK